MHQPENAEVFERKLALIQDSKQKASHLLFDAIEAEVADKEEFVRKMSAQIDEMQKAINKLDDQKRVLDYVLEMMPFVQEAGKVASAQ